MLEENKYYYGDFLAKKLQEYPEIISKSIGRKIDNPISSNEVFICVKMQENHLIAICSDESGKLSPTGRKSPCILNTYAKIKEGKGEFGEWRDYDGISDRAINVAIDFAEKSAREKLGDMISEDCDVEGILLKNDDYNFEVDLHNEFKSKYDIRTVDIEKLSKEITNLCKTIVNKGKGKIKSCRGELRSELEFKLLGNSAGGLTFQKVPRTILAFRTIEFPHRIVDPYCLFTGHKEHRYGIAGGLEMFYDFLDGKYIELDDFLDGIVKESIDFCYNSKSIDKLGFKPYKGVNIILSPSASGTFVHEALGHHVEQDEEDDNYGARFLSDHLGETVASDNLSIFFDPMYNNNLSYRPYGSYFYDDEGTKARKTFIIKDGIAIDTLTDLTSGKRQGSGSNGHSLRDYIRMSNLLIDDKKSCDKSELFEDIKGNGFYVDSALRGFTSPVAKQARVHIASLYFIDKNCELIPVSTLNIPKSKKRGEWAMSGFNLSIDSSDILHKVKMLGKSDRRPNILSHGHCGKAGEWTPTADGGAYLLLENLLLTHNELDAPRKNLFL